MRQKSKLSPDTEPQDIETPHGWPLALWIIRCLGHAGVLCAGASQPLVRSGLCRRMRPRIAVRFSSGCVAVWDSGSHLVCGCRAAMVAQRGSRMKSTATESQPIACTLIEIVEKLIDGCEVVHTSN